MKKVVILKENELHNILMETIKDILTEDTIMVQREMEHVVPEIEMQRRLKTSYCYDDIIDDNTQLTWGMNLLQKISETFSDIEDSHFIPGLYRIALTELGWGTKKQDTEKINKLHEIAKKIYDDPNAKNRVDWNLNDMCFYDLIDEFDNDEEIEHMEQNEENNMSQYLTKSDIVNILGISYKTLDTWLRKGKIKYIKNSDGSILVPITELDSIPIIKDMESSKWEEELDVKPLRTYTSIELFAGGGGLALGLEKAGFQNIMLNEIDHNACDTIRKNRPNWNVDERDIHTIDFTPYRGKVDLLTGGFPCQAFSYAGEKRGFEDARGTLFFEMARAIKEIQPKVFMGENVKGLMTHDGGKTISVIEDVIRDLGYTLIEPKVLKAILYQVPQKRERVFLVAIRNDIASRVNFDWPSPYHRVSVVKDALCKGILYDTDVPQSKGQTYADRKREIMDMIPQGGNWSNLPIEIQKEYMKGSFGTVGGKTGMARRLSMNEPCPTLMCSPAMKQTDRCHPLETRPLNVREYARIQTFPDDWEFFGNISNQYKQIGNAVPVNLAYAVGRSLIRLFNDIERTNK